MRTSLLIIWLFALVFLGNSNIEAATRSGSILVFSKTAAFRHSSIATGKKVLMQLILEMGMNADTTEDASIFNDYNSLKKYKCIIFLHTTGDILNNQQEVNFQQYIQAGGGFVGIHAASDTEYDWPWYGALVGGYFMNHPAIQNALIKVQDTHHPSTKHLPLEWKRTDEWYNFKMIEPSLHVLLTIDESSYNGGKNGLNHPMSWYHKFDGGFAWYTALGHTDASYEDPLFLQHLRGGIEWVMRKG